MYSVYLSLGARPGLYKDEYERRYKQTADAAYEEDAGDGHREVLEHTEHHAENRAHKRDAQRGKETLAAVAAPISAGEMFMVMKGATQLLRKV